MNLDSKSYNRYLKVAKLACDNIKAAICSANRLSNPSVIQVRIKDKQKLVECVADIMHDPTGAKQRCEAAINDILVVSASFPVAKQVNWNRVFVDSVTRSRNARVCQKCLIDILSAELYFKQAYAYDVKHGGKSGIAGAKVVIVQMYSQAFLDNFDFTGEPCVNSGIKTTLEKQVFDKRYSLADTKTNDTIVQKRYAKDFASRQDFFMSKAETPKPFSTRFGFGGKKSSQTGAPKNIPSLKQTKASVDSMLINDLYKNSFANIPAQNKIRRFVNLQLRNKDIAMCPVRNLPAKRQYAAIDAMTKHEYIRSYYEDELAKLPRSTNKNDFYFSQELRMYQYMWGDMAFVESRGDRLYFSDGGYMEVPNGFTPHEFLHEINITYGAMFGFNPDDMKGGNNWLYDSIRKAYTDEGMAEYRLTLIDKRLGKK